MEVTNRYITVKAHVEGEPTESAFEIKSSTISTSVQPDSNDIILKNLYVSIDPYQINRIKSHSASHTTSSFAVVVTPGETIDAYGLARVVASGNPEFEKGDLVVGMITWGEYCVLKGEYMLRKLDPMGFPLSYHVGIFAFSGLTAYAGLFEVGKPKKGEKVFVSAASGSVGHLVGQYAKQFGCYVVGSAGSNEKVALLKEKLGFDDAFNYKEETDLKSALKRYFPDGIDVYFDNVGGEMLEAAVANMNIYGRIAACGVIAEYTDAGKRAAPDMLEIVYKRITIHGFLSSDYMNLYPDFLSATVDHLRTGAIQTIEDISSGVESIAPAFVGLFHGANTGKKIVKLADE